MEAEGALGVAGRTFAAEDASTLRTAAPPVPLEQVAAVHAALAEGFDLQVVLASEELKSGQWREAELWHLSRITDVHGEPFAIYRAALQEHQDRIGGKVVPLENDVEGWLTFLKQYEASDNKSSFLVGLGLTNNHLARLQRRWSKLLEHREVAREMTKTKRRLERGPKHRVFPMPPLRVEKSQLVASPSAGHAAAAEVARREEETARKEFRKLVSSFPLDVYAALCAELTSWPESRAVHLERYQLDEERLHALDDAWKRQLQSDSHLERDFRALVQHYQQRAELRKQRLPGHGLASVNPMDPTEGSNETQQPSSLDETAALLILDDSELETSGLLGNAFLYDEALPFQPPKSAAELGIFPIGHLLPEHEEKGETAYAFNALRDDDLFPFPTAASEPSAKVEAVEDDTTPGSAAAGRMPSESDLDETSMVSALDLSLPALPFVAAVADESEAVVKPEGGDGRDLKSAGMDSAGLEQTRHFKVEHYASLCAELRVSPEAYWEILARYGLSEQHVWNALVQRFEAAFRVDPALRSRCAQLQVAYEAHLREKLSRNSQ